MDQPRARVYGTVSEAVVFCPACGLACPVDPWVRCRSPHEGPMLRSRLGTMAIAPIHAHRVPSEVGHAG